MTRDAFPLQWPIGRPRTQTKKGDPFHVPAGKIRSDLARELKLMGSDDFTITSNLMIRRDGIPYAGQREPEDSGVAVYFTRNGEEICISCDQYAKIDVNLRAISKTIEAIRGIERWGTEEMMDAAFKGFAALPESVIVTPYTTQPWHEILEVSPTASPEVVKAAYRQMLHRHHPDKGGDITRFEQVQRAYRESGADHA